MDDNLRNQNEAMPIFMKEESWLDTEPLDTSAQVVSTNMRNDVVINQANRVNLELLTGRQTISTSVQQQETTSVSGTNGGGLLSSDIIYQYVNLNSVRKMIPQNIIEFLLICVIVIYLIYYFSQISRVSI